MTAGYILAIDQGTTSTRSMIFDRAARVVAVAQAEQTDVDPHERARTAEAVLWRRSKLGLPAPAATAARVAAHPRVPA